MNVTNNWKKLLGNALTNWQQPLPLPHKLWLLMRNLTVRALKRQTCCGHHGEPGC
jgi:hypothetical protein